MIAPILARVAKLWGLLAMAACLSNAACGGERRSVLSLPEQLGVAEVVGNPQALAADLRIPAGSVVSYHFPLPEGARILGMVSSHGGAVARVEIQHESGLREVLLEGSGSLAADLGAHAGEMLRLRFSAEGPDDGFVLWQSPRIEGARRSQAPARIARGSYNVLLVLLDSLRADQTAPYGATEVRTPALAQLADTGVTFVRARSSASWTRPAVAAMFTSLSPPSHGVLTYEQRLAGTAPFLPEILQGAGYYTVAVVDNPMVSPEFGFGRGFEEVIERWKIPGAPNRGAGPGSQAARVWSRFVAPALERAGSRPFLVYLHELDPHSPYDAPEPFGSFYGSDGSGAAGSTVERLRAIRERPGDFSAEDIRGLRAQYRGEITYMDRYVDGILRALAEAGLSESTLVVFVSDHGEEFFDHGSVGHGHTVYEEQLRVPFVMRLPGVIPAGRRVEANVGLIDLAPTLLDLLGLPIPETMQGSSLLPSLAAGDEDPERPHFGYAAAPPSESASFGRWKLIRDLGTQPPRSRLFDLESDPLEQSDLADTQPVVVGTLAQMLRARRVGASTPEPSAAGEPPEAVVERLRALGYAE